MPGINLEQRFAAFNGSAGTLVLGIDCGFCWSDGRYFIQAEKQLNEYFELMQMGDAGVPTILEFFREAYKGAESD